MNTPFFYEPHLTQQNNMLMPLSADTAKHCGQVLRMRAGEKIRLTNGQGLVGEAVLTEISKKNATVLLSNFQQHQPPTSTVTIAISPVKNAARFEWFLEKATEIGIAQIIPTICERTEKQFVKMERWQNILVSAMLQSQQSFLPILQPATPFKQLLATTNDAVKLIAHCLEAGNKTTIAQQLQNNIQPSVQILIGPEGDFSETEINVALQNSYQPVTLGSTRLRTETAGIVAACLLKHYV